MSKPWETKSAKSTGKTKLTPESIEWARARAKAAGRRYPNLVDNMAATRRQTEATLPAKGPGFLRKLLRAGGRTLSQRTPAEIS